MTSHLNGTGNAPVSTAVVRSTATRLRGGADVDRHVAFLCYELGHAGVNLPSLAGHFWRAPGAECGSLPCLRVEAARLGDATERLTPSSPGGRAKKLLREIRKLAARAIDAWEAAWNAEEYSEYRSLLGEMDLDDVAVEAPPFAAPFWDDLTRTVEACAGAMPSELGAWVRLGALAAKVLDPYRGGAPGLESVPPLLNHLSSMSPQRLLAGLTLDPSRASREGVVADWHARVRQRLAAEAPAEEAPSPVPSSGPATPPRQETDLIQAASEWGITKGVLALAMRCSNPDMTDAAIAEAIGISRTSLYRDPHFKEWRKAVKPDRGRVRKGVRSRGRDGVGFVDGVDDHDPSQEARD